MLKKIFSYEVRLLQLLRLNYDNTDLVFRVLFSLIFLGLGMEHLFSDQLIREMMPDWFVYKKFLSIASGCILVLGGFSVMLGFRTRQGAFILGCFLIVVSFTVHAPATIIIPDSLPEKCHDLWLVYQRSNFVKNLCLLGVCFHLINHKLGKYSIDRIRREKTLKASKKIR